MGFGGLSSDGIGRRPSGPGEHIAPPAFGFLPLPVEGSEGPQKITRQAAVFAQVRCRSQVFGVLENLSAMFFGTDAIPRAPGIEGGDQAGVHVQLSHRRTALVHGEFPGNQGLQCLLGPAPVEL